MVYSAMRYKVVLLEPAQRFIAGLHEKLKAKALRAIDLLEDFGPYLAMPHARKLRSHDIWELRVKQGSDICRLFCFHHAGVAYIVTSGYVKKSDKTNPLEIERAERLRQQVLSAEDR